MYWAIGALLVVVGILAKLFPDKLIAGYNTMSPEEKKNVDVKKLSSALLCFLLFMAVAISGGNYLLNYLGRKDLIPLIGVVIFIAAIVFLIYAQRFDHNGKKKQ